MYNDIEYNFLLLMLNFRKWPLKFKIWPLDKIFSHCSKIYCSPPIIPYGYPYSACTHVFITDVKSKNRVTVGTFDRYTSIFIFFEIFFDKIKIQYFIYLTCIYYFPITFISLSSLYRHFRSKNVRILTFCHSVENFKYQHARWICTHVCRNLNWRLCTYLCRN